MARKATYGENVSNIAKQALVDRMYADREGEAKDIDARVRATIGRDQTEDEVAAATAKVEQAMAYERARAIKAHFQVRVDAGGAVVKLRDAKDAAQSAADRHTLEQIAQEMREADANRFDTIAARVAKQQAKRAASPDSKAKAKLQAQREVVTVPAIEIPH